MLAPSLALLLASAAPAAPVGWFRDGGDAWVPDGRLPARWTDAVAWKVPTPAWSNGSPAVIGDAVCFPSEPTTLTCVDAATGDVRWSKDHPYDVTVPAKEAAAWRIEAAAIAERAARLQALQERFSLVRREMRRDPGHAAHAAELAALQSELADLVPRVDADRAYGTPPDREVIGYTTHSVATDGQRLFALFGHGVVVAYRPDGTRLWAAWAGPAPGRMRGYYVGTAASPVLVDGLVIVGHGQLVAYDAATGAERWRSVAYDDYGTPAVARVGATAVVVTPKGELVRAADGALLDARLDDPWFVGPLVVGDLVVQIGGNASDQSRRGDPVRATAWRLAETAPGTVTAREAWRVVLPTDAKFYVPPTSDGVHAWTVDTDGAVWRVALADGAATAIARLRLGPVYPSPQLVGGDLLVGGETGAFAVLDPATGAVRAEHRLDTVRSTPVVVGRRTYVRTLTHLWCLDADVSGTAPEGAPP